MKKFEWKTVKQRIGKGKKKVIAVTVVLCLVAATAGGVISKKNKSNASDNKAISTNVRTGTIKESVSGTGTISYASATDIEIPSDLEIDEVMVSEGSYVEQGDLLATVDETSLAVCIADVSDEIESLDSTISSELSSTTTKYITAGVSGTVEKIYGEVGADVADVMVEYGALMLVKNGDETIKVVGSDGTITAVNVSEGGTVSASSKVFTLESDAQSGDYLQAVKDREELVSILETLLSIKKNGGITASIEGMVETVNVIGTSKESSSDSKDSASVEESESLTSSDSASVEENETSSSSDSVSVEESESLTTSDSASVEGTEPVVSSDEVHKITAVTMTNLSSASVSEFGTAAATATTDKMKILEELKAGYGRIEGTTKDMEYADSLEAKEWTECADEYTEVNIGKWYVRYKATESEEASEAVEIEVTEETVASGENSSGSVSSDNSSSSGNSNSNSTSGKNDSNSDTSNAAGSNTDSTGSNSSSSNSGLTSGKSGSSSNNSSDSSSSDSNSSDSSSIAGSNTGSSNTDSGSSSSKNSTSSGGESSSGKSSGGSGSGSASEKSSGGSGSSSSSKSGSSGSSSSSKSSSSGGSSGSGSSSGSSLVSTTAAFTIANGDKMKVTVNVDELDILTMEEGLSAEITLDAVENKTFTGTITNVSGTASGSNGSTQYPVEITFDRTEEMLSGMNASVAVIIEEAADVLTIPLVAVTDEGRTSYVYTSYDEATGELSGKTEVTLGMSDENSVEVKEGLAEGDTVYYEMQVSDSSDNSKSGRSGMGGMGIPGMGSSSDMKMGGDRPSGSNGGERPSGSGSGDRPSGGNGGDRSSGTSGSKSKDN